MTTAHQIAQLFDELAKAAHAWADATNPELPQPPPPYGGWKPHSYPCSGPGVAHWIPSPIPEGVSWGYDTSHGAGVFWRDIEPQPDQFDFSKLVYWLRRLRTAQAAPGTPAALWLAIMTAGKDLHGQPKAPQWAVEGAGQSYIDSGDASFFYPGDPYYQHRLRNLLDATFCHLMDLQINEPEVAETVGGIVMMSGACYGELQVWSAGGEEAVAGQLHTTPDAFRGAFITSITEIFDIYAVSLPKVPLMAQIGWPAVDHFLLSHIQQHSAANQPVFIKWAGLDPANVGDGKDEVRLRAREIYHDLRNTFPELKWGFELGHPALLQDNGTYSCARWKDVLEWCIEVEADFLAIQGGDPLNNYLQEGYEWPGAAS